jgi:adenylate cyclase
LNIANSIITNRFVRRSSLATDLLVIIAMGIVTAVVSWQLRPILSFFAGVSLLVGYAALSVAVFVQHLYWLPVVLPLGGSLLIQYLCLATWRVVFEQTEKRRVKSIFSTVVSPKIMVELLKAEKLSLGGARREVTVMFADVRGFTDFTDKSQERAAAQVTAQRLSGPAAEACYDEMARVTLATVNLYLGVVADTVIQHDATLDKFIGDCVMAFWGAPAANPSHAVACVRAAIEAQRAIHSLNEQRAIENQQREQENARRTAAGLEPIPLLELLRLGSGINTGIVTVGLMGSETKSGVRHGNYTVFGRDVNLASRLEGLSGRGRIFISEKTYEQLQRDDPALAATCVLQPPAKLKGIGEAGKVFEVPWQKTGAPSSGSETGAPKPA